MPVRNLGSGWTVCHACETNDLLEPHERVVHDGDFETGGFAYSEHLVRVHPDRFWGLAESTGKRLLDRAA